MRYRDPSEVSPNAYRNANPLLLVVITTILIGIQSTTLRHTCHLPFLVGVPTIQGVESVAGGKSHDPWIIDMIQRGITTLLSIISTFSSLHTTLCFIYYTLIHISCSDFINSFVLITHRLFKSWQEGATLLLLLLFHSAPGEADNLSIMKFLMTISAPYLTIAIIIEVTIQNPTTSLVGDHRWKQWASSHHIPPPCQHVWN